MGNTQKHLLAKLKAHWPSLKQAAAVRRLTETQIHCWLLENTVGKRNSNNSYHYKLLGAERWHKVETAIQEAGIAARLEAEVEGQAVIPDEAFKLDSEAAASLEVCSVACCPVPDLELWLSTLCCRRSVKRSTSHMQSS